MDDICRLCCSTKFVNNNIFDDENALYLKMSLYLPIKVFKNDRLPQKICDRCSCKVNDFYQFCNETIEVQNRLRALVVSSAAYMVGCAESVDLTRVKHSASPPPPAPPAPRREQATQTDTHTDVPQVKVKDEPKPVPSPHSPSIKQEDYSLDFTCHLDNYSSDENISLVKLKKKKAKKSLQNGSVPQKRGRKKKNHNVKLEETNPANAMSGWEMLMNVLPDHGALDGNSVDAIESKDLKDQKPEFLLGEVSLSGLKQEVYLNSTSSDLLQEFDQEVFNCCMCFAKIYNRTEMLQHYRQHGSEAAAGSPPAPAPPPPPPPAGDHEPLRCARCRKELSRAEWSRHWLRHYERDRRPYRCALCEKSFRDPQMVLKHGQTHSYGAGAGAGAGAVEPADKRFLCDLCPEGFVYMRFLLAHRTRAHPEAAGRALSLRCGRCSRSFAHINSLRRHLRAHSGERNFLCNVCGKALSSREHLKFHIRIHTGYKPNVCKTCGKGFVKKCNLTLHERVHSGEKPHVCSHCGKAFSQRSTLVIHERYHSGARPYSCGLCGRGFVAKGLLSMHLKTTCI